MDDTTLEDTHEDHTHVPPYQTASLVSARLCTTCGAYVGFIHLKKHTEWHESLDPSAGPTLNEPVQLSLGFDGDA